MIAADWVIIPVTPEDFWDAGSTCRPPSHRERSAAEPGLAKVGTSRHPFGRAAARSQVL
jgi:hypothetical protein